MFKYRKGRDKTMSRVSHLFVRLVSIAVLLSVIFGIGSMPKAMAQNQDSTTKVFEEVPGVLIQVSKDNQSLKLEGAEVRYAGNWAYVFPKDVSGSEVSVLRESLTKLGYKTYPNRLVISPPQIRGLSSLENFSEEQGENLEFDGSDFMNPNWYNEVLGLGVNSTLPLIHRTEKPMACVVDSAIDVGRNSKLMNVSEKSYNFLTMNQSPNGSYSNVEGIHGTTTATLLLGGLGTNSNLVEFVHLVSLSDYFGGTEFQLASAIYYGADVGCDVFSMSLGFGSDTFQSPIIEDAFNYAKAKGSVFVIASGNEGGFVSYPANLHADIIAGAVDRGLVRPSFSNRPKNDDEASRFLSAPGHRMVLDVPRWYYSGEDLGSGTSYSTPLVSALVLNEMLYHQVSAKEAVNMVLQSSRSSGSSNPESWVPYASIANRIPKISDISIVSGVLIEPQGTIVVEANVSFNDSDPVLRYIESGTIISSAKMVSLGNGKFRGEIEVSNTAQSRSKVLWVEAENSNGLYRAPTPVFLMIGKNLQKPEVIWTGVQNPNEVVEIGIRWEGVYDFAWVMVSNYLYNYEKWYRIPFNGKASITLGCQEELWVRAFLVSGQTVYPTSLESLDIQNAPSDCIPENQNYLGTKPEMVKNSSHLVFAPSWIEDEIEWVVQTANQPTVSIKGEHVLNLKSIPLQVEVGDQLIVTAFWNDFEASLSETIVVTPEFFQVHLPLVGN